MARLPKFALVGLTLVALLLIVTGAALADWKITGAVYAWDNGTLNWVNSNAELWLNTDLESFTYELVNGSGVFDGDNDVVSNACGVGTSTILAGSGEIGLYHTDTAADLNAPGFQSTTNYQLVDCSALNAGGNSADDVELPAAGDILATCTADNSDGIVDRCEIVSQDVVTPCGAGNCTNEIVTGLQVNMDTDCDGNLDPGFSSDVCLWFQAEKPPFAEPFWAGNIQVRIATGGGDKTVNFTELRGPTAVTLQTLQAVPPAAPILLLAGLLLLVGVLAYVTLRAWQRYRHQARKL